MLYWSYSFIYLAEDGRVKYKVNFEEKGRSLVSGHHIALDNPPKLDELYVGARVVIQSADDELSFLPGILAELPSRKNRLRFVFEWVLHMFITRTQFWCFRNLIVFFPEFLKANIYKCINKSFILIHLNFSGSWSFWMTSHQSTRVYLHFTWFADHVSVEGLFFLLVCFFASQ